MGYTYDDIIKCLNKLSIQKGDNIFIHSNLGYFGKLEGCKNADEMCKKFFHAIISVIGEEGTIAVPTFTYSFCHGELFDIDNTETKCGLFPKYIRKVHGALRSADPNFSITAYGFNKYIYTENPANESFGKGCFWERFMNTDGKIMCMNFDSGSTFVHYVERLNNVPYRYNKAFNGEIKVGKKFIRDYFVHYVYDNNIDDDAPCFDKLDLLCKENGICNSAVLGKGIINIMDSKKYCKFISGMMEEEPRFLTVGGNK